MYVTMIPILEHARENHYGVMAPNIIDEVTARAAIQAAVEKKAPVILDIALKSDVDEECVAWVTRRLAERVNVPVALNLDHGRTFDVCMRALRAGFSSIMIDRSTLPFEENVREVAEMVKICHAVGVSVEAELGHVGSGAKYDEDRDVGLTTVAEANEFVARTGIDCLAIAIGTAHGMYAKDVVPRIDFDRLVQLRKEVSIPLVLHGGSEAGDDNLVKAGQLGITKFNIGTDNFNSGMRHAIAANLKSGRDFVPKYCEGYKELVMHFMDLLGVSGRAV